MTGDRANECSVCGGPTADWFAVSARTYQRCRECGLICVKEGLAKGPSGLSIYEEEDSVFLQDGNASYYLDESNLRSCELKHRWVMRFLRPGSSLLDVGSNFGHFLKAVSPDLVGRGLELSPAAVRWGRENLGVDAHVGSAYAIPDTLRGPHDAVCLWDVIEHLEQPLLALREAHAVLKPGGYLFLSTPDAGSFAARLLGRRWHYLDPVQHLHLFARSNLVDALQRSGFRVVVFRRFGHYYRIRYVFDRLEYLHPSHVARCLLRVLRFCCFPLLRMTAYVSLGDVMGVAAQKVA